MLILAGHVYVDPARVGEFVAEARATLPGARATEGCLFCSFTLDDPATGSVLVLERWRDQAALSARLAAPEVVEMFGKWGGAMRNEVRKYDAANERLPLA